MNNENDAAIEELTPEVEEVKTEVVEATPDIPKTPELKEADIVISTITTDPVQVPTEPIEEELVPTEDEPVVEVPSTEAPEEAPVEEIVEEPVVPETTPEPTPEPVVEETSEEAVEEPVMIATIDEPVEEVQVEEPVVEVPTDAPALGQPEVVTEPSVPTFQTFPEENDTVVEETPEVVEPTPEPTTEPIAVPVPEETTESYQASSQTEVVPTFQQMPEAPETTPVEQTTTLDEEEPIVEEKPKTVKRIIPLVIVLLIFATIGGFIYVNMNNKPSTTTDTETLIPVRSETGKTNVLIVGTNESKKSTVFPSIVGVTENDIKECPSEKNRLEYHLIRKGTTINGTDYEVVYPCNLSSTFNYMIDSEGDNTIDGAVLIINADQENVVQAKGFMESLRKTGVKKLVVYIVGSLNVEFIARDIRDAISETGFENNTPVLIASNSSIDELKAKINQTIIRETPSSGPSAVQSHKEIKLYTHFLSEEEGGMEEALKGDVILNLEIGSEYYTVQLTIPKDADPIKPGDNGEISVELDRQLPLETGIRIQVYQNSKVIGVGVISELN